MIAWFRRWQDARAQSKRNAERIKQHSKKNRPKGPPPAGPHKPTRYEADQDFVTRFGDPFDG